MKWWHVKKLRNGQYICYDELLTFTEGQYSKKIVINKVYVLNLRLKLNDVVAGKFYGRACH